MCIRAGQRSVCPSRPLLVLRQPACIPCMLAVHIVLLPRVCRRQYTSAGRAPAADTREVGNVCCMRNMQTDAGSPLKSIASVAANGETPGVTRTVLQSHLSSATWTASISTPALPTECGQKSGAEECCRRTGRSSGCKRAGRSSGCRRSRGQDALEFSHGGVRTVRPAKERGQAVEAAVHACGRWACSTPRTESA